MLFVPIPIVLSFAKFVWENVMCRWQDINKHVGFLKSAMVRITLNTPLPFDGESLAAVLEHKGTT